MKTLLLAFAVLALASCATSPSPQTRAQRAASLFDELDTNRDGYLTRAELAAGLRYAGTPELNPNLVLGLEKTTVPSKKKVKAARKLSEAEIQRAMSEAFGVRDENLDRRLSKDEFKKLVVERPRGAADDPWEPFM
jgi:Ca2+-binding EF-hand superfamily protein